MWHLSHKSLGFVDADDVDASPGAVEINGSDFGGVDVVVLVVVVVVAVEFVAAGAAAGAAALDAGGISIFTSTSGTSFFVSLIACKRPGFEHATTTTKLNR